MTMKAGRVNVRRLTGMGAVATLALAVLVFGCVLAATAGPREALAARTQALRQTISTLPASAQTVTVSSDWNSFMDDGAILQQSALNDSDLSDLDAQLNADFNHGAVRMAPVSADWVAMTTVPQSTSLENAGNAVQVELSLRVPETGYLRVLAGNLDAPAARNRAYGFPTVIDVAVTRQTAEQLGLKVGSAVTTGGVFVPSLGKNMPVKYRVAAIVAESQPASAFWQDDPAMSAPVLIQPRQSPPYWLAGAFALPGETAAIQTDYGSRSLNLQWVLPVSLAGVTGDQAQPLAAGLTSITSQNPKLTGPFAIGASGLRVSTSLQQVLGTFLDTAASVDVLLWLLYVSLAVTAAVVLLLAARMTVMRRLPEFALRRARGASLLQTGLAAARGTLISCLPAAVLAGAAAVLLVPGQAPPGGWWPGLAVLAVAIAAPAAIAVWQQRLPRSVRGRASGGYSRPGQPSLGYGALDYGRRGRRRFRAGARLVAELTLIAAAIAGIVVFRQQGLQPGTGVDFYTSTAPVLVAIPAVIIVLRVYPLILRGLLKGAARGRSATGFLGLARAARTALTPALPAFALVLAITVAAFTGMVRDAVIHGEVSASWQTVGADVAISDVDAAGSISAAAEHALAAVSGVEHAATVADWQMDAPDGSPLTALAVSPAAYAALVASEQGWPAVKSGLLDGNGVLVSPQALKDFDGSRTPVLTQGKGVAPLRVRVTGVLSGTPALPAGGAFVLMSDALASRQPAVTPNVMLLNGPGIDTTRATALVSKMVPTAVTVIRSEILGSLTGAPVQRGASGLFILALVVAAGLGLAVMLLQLALGAADREAALARLATMGLGQGQRARLVLLEVLPAVLAAAVAAVACALVLPRIVAPAINLSVFTGTTAAGSGVRVPLTTDAASFLLPIAGLVLVAAVTLGIEIGARRGVVATLRGGE
jgi:putative ABC transport system permease protein